MTRKIGSEKFPKLRLIIFANGLTDFKTPGFANHFACKSMRDHSIADVVLIIIFNGILRKINEA